MTLDDVKDLLTYCRTHGVVQIKFGDLEAILTPEPTPPASPSVDNPTVTDDLTFWSGK